MADIGDEALKGLAAIAAGITGLAIIAVIVGQNAQTGNVISAMGGALSSVIGAAVAPVSGGSSSGLSQSNPLGDFSSGSSYGSGSSGLFPGYGGSYSPFGSSYAGGGYQPIGSFNPGGDLSQVSTVGLDSFAGL